MKNVEIFPSKIKGRVQAPPSKSMAHRLLICAGLSAGESVVSGVAPSEDILATIDCLRAIGAEVRYDGESVRVCGVDLDGVSVSAPLPCRECGSTLRFFIPIALLSKKETVLTGSERLMQRPLSVYEELCAAHGNYYEKKPDGVHVRGTLKSGHYVLPGDVSSQFISGLLFALPLTQGDSVITITEPIESRAYIDLTVSALARFGVRVNFAKANEILIPGGQRYLPEKVTVDVEGDYSNAAFFEALNVLGGDVTVDGLSAESLQGDRIYRKYFAELERGMPTLSIASCPDLGPVLFVVAAAKHGGVFTDTRRLKIKESDRGGAMAEELVKFGVKLNISEDSITVPKTDIHAPDAELSGHGDHRIVMALATLLTVTGGKISGADAVSKSMPDFFDKMEVLGAKVRYYET